MKRAALIAAVLTLLALTAALAQASSGILGVFNFNCNTGGRCVEVRNSGSGVGVFGRTDTGTSGAIRGVTTSDNNFGVGVWGRAPANVGVVGEGGVLLGDYGGIFEGRSGVGGSATNSFGAYGYSAYNIGVRGYSNGNEGLDYGGSFASAGGRGLTADGASGFYDALFPDCARIGGSTYGSCLETMGYSEGMAVIALNNGSSPIAPGDVLIFQGMGAVEGLNESVLLVARATGAPGEVVIGVMRDAYELVLAEAGSDPLDMGDPAAALPSQAPEGEDPLPGALSSEAAMAITSVAQTGDAGFSIAGNAEPGGLLFVQIQGIALVNIDPTAGNIIAGASLTASGNGLAQGARGELAESGLLIGRALEAPAKDASAVYVLLGAR